MADIPLATYRLQFNAGFTFDDARAIVPYLAGLGITHVYASPFLRARAGSQHGYDIADHTQLNPELGDRAAFDALIRALRERGLGLVADFVPNHMGLAAVRLWLAEAHQHDSLHDYVQSLRGQPVEDSPLTRLAAQAAAGARSAARGQPREQVELAARRATRDAVFLFFLVMQCLRCLLTQHPLIGLRGRLLASDLVHLTSGDAEAIALWRFEAEQAWVDLAALQAALDHISAERLGGATPLFPDLAAVPDDWLVLTGRLLDLFADRHAPDWNWRQELQPRLAAERDALMRMLVAMARAEALQALGDQRGAYSQIDRIVFGDEVVGD